MVDHDLLHAELAALAATATGDFDMHEALYQLSVTASAALGLDGAGVTLSMPDGRMEYVTGTDAITLHVEQMQDASSRVPASTRSTRPRSSRSTTSKPK